MNIKKDKEGNVEGCFQLTYCRECLIFDDCPYAELPNKIECSYITKDGGGS